MLDEMQAGKSGIHTGHYYFFERLVGIVLL